MVRSENRPTTKYYHGIYKRRQLLQQCETGSSKLGNCEIKKLHICWVQWWFVFPLREISFTLFDSQLTCHEDHEEWDSACKLSYILNGSESALSSLEKEVWWYRSGGMGISVGIGEYHLRRATWFINRGRAVWKTLERRI